MSGYVECSCCGTTIIGISGDKCEGCRNGYGDGAGSGCDMATTWHCFTFYCDGSGCTYPGECQEKGDTFRDYHAWDRVKLSEDSPYVPGELATVTVGRLDTGEVAIKADGAETSVNISPIYLTPADA